jgi:kynurenine formamidase
MDLRQIDPGERGRLAEVTPADVVSTLHSVRDGRVYDLDPGRFVGMPQWDGHPTFLLTTFRTPRGTRVQRDIELLESANSEDFRFLSELMVTSMHVGTHIDALCHVTCGGDGWWGGYSADDEIGDFGARRCDAATIPPIIVPATLLDVAGHRGVDGLPAGAAVSAEELRAVEEVQQTPIEPRSAVFVRTGLMRHWHDPPEFNAVAGAGPDLEAARWLRGERDVVLVGSDTPTVEQVPSGTESNPHPVHDYLLRQEGVHLLENAYLEQLAADGVHRFVLLCLPLRIAGATGSMVRPVAVI